MFMVRGESPDKSAFTLIELLIVIAIIAILALIAIPNFLEAQIRSKVARVKADMRMVATGLEAYFVDQNAYPTVRIIPGSGDPINRNGIFLACGLSTPIAYLTTTAVPDPFFNGLAYNEYGRIYSIAADSWFTLHYINIFLYRFQQGWQPYRHPCGGWLVLSLGPDKKKGPDETGALAQLSDYGTESRAAASHNYLFYTYDPTNGTVSGGDIFRSQLQSPGK